MWVWDEGANIDFMYQIEMWFFLIKLGMVDFDI
jgi:hypothetical protein